MYGADTYAGGDSANNGETTWRNNMEKQQAQS